MAQSFWAEFLGGKISYYNAGGINTRCLEYGEGEPVICLHGMGGHAEAYIRNIKPLGEHFHVYAIDMAGSGYSDPPVNGEGVPGLLDHLMKFIEAIGASSVHLIGESLGGWVSTWAAIQYPDKIKSVTSVCGAGLNLDPEDQELAAKGLEGLTRLSQESFHHPTRENVRKRLAWLFLDPEKSITDELLEIRYQIYTRILNEQKGSMQDVAKRGGRGPEWQITRKQLSEIHVPYFFLWSDHNPTTPWQVAEKAHLALSGSQFEVIKDCGHWPQYEQTEAFNRLALHFLKNV